MRYYLNKELYVEGLNHLYRGTATIKFSPLGTKILYPNGAKIRTKGPIDNQALSTILWLGTLLPIEPEDNIVVNYDHDNDIYTIPVTFGDTVILIDVSKDGGYLSFSKVGAIETVKDKIAELVRDIGGVPIKKEMLREKRSPEVIIDCATVVYDDINPSKDSYACTVEGAYPQDPIKTIEDIKREAEKFRKKIEEIEGVVIDRITDFDATSFRIDLGIGNADLSLEVYPYARFAPILSRFYASDTVNTDKLKILLRRLGLSNWDIHLIDFLWSLFEGNWDSQSYLSVSEDMVVIRSPKIDARIKRHHVPYLIPLVSKFRKGYVTATSENPDRFILMYDPNSIPRSPLSAKITVILEEDNWKVWYKPYEDIAEIVRDLVRIPKDEELYFITDADLFELFFTRSHPGIIYLNRIDVLSTGEIIPQPIKALLDPIRKNLIKLDSALKDIGIKARISRHDEAIYKVTLPTGETWLFDALVGDFVSSSIQERIREKLRYL